MSFISKIIDRIFLPSEKRIDRVMEEAVKKMKIVRSDSNGFSITSLDGSKDIVARWSDIDDVKIKPHELTTIKNGKTRQMISESVTGWYALIQNVPSGYKSYDYQYVKSFFDNLQGCEICGLLAVNNDECCACGSEVWNDSLKSEFESKSDYIKEEQILLFEPEEGEAIDINNKEESGFKSDPNWKPLITEEDF